MATHKTQAQANVVGLLDIAERSNTAPSLVRRWRSRAASTVGVRAVPFPDPAGYISGQLPWWWWPDIAAWLIDTGRAERVE